MSVINANQFGTGFIGASASELEPTLAQSSYGSTTLPQYSDNILTGSPIALPITTPIGSPVSGSGNGWGGGYGSGSPSLGGFGATFNSILNQIGSAIQNLFNQISQSFGSAGSGSTTPTTGNTNPETYFSSATANSVGDPHLSFNGTNASGDTVSGTWNNMGSHANLLSSDSFNGGYTESTVATTPNSSGITYNQSATVTTDGGATSVTMQKNGSYGVTENGQNVSLTQGTATRLGNGESVTLNANGSLTIDERNHQGGSIDTTLQSDGDGGVDVKNTATNVDLGGYLVDRSDSDSSPVAYAESNGWNQSPVSGTPSYPSSGELFGSSAMQQLESTYGNELNSAGGEYGIGAGSPMIEGLQSYDPESQSSSLQNIELA